MKNKSLLGLYWIYSCKLYFVPDGVHNQMIIQTCNSLGLLLEIMFFGYFYMFCILNCGAYNTDYTGVLLYGFSWRYFLSWPYTTNLTASSMEWSVIIYIELHMQCNEYFVQAITFIELLLFYDKNIGCHLVWISCITWKRGETNNFIFILVYKLCIYVFLVHILI